MVSWDAFRRRHFPTARINLNPGTLGTPSLVSQRAAAAFFEGENHAYPLGQYQRGREDKARARAAAQAFFGEGAEALALSGATTEVINLILLALVASPPMSAPGSLSVLTSHHEHYGGLAGFERHPGITVEYLPDAELASPEAIAHRAPRFDVVFLSHVTWTEGRVLPVEAIGEALRRASPNTFFIVDLAQSLGLIPPPVASGDLLVGSGHKWLSLPLGSGFLWASKRARAHLGGIWWGGEPLDSGDAQARWEPSGGHNFALYAGVAAGLELLNEPGQAAITQRSQALADTLRRLITERLEAMGIPFRFLPLEGKSAPGMVVLDLVNADPYPAYRHMNENQAHVKCIKKELGDGRILNALRFGLPFWESEARLSRAVDLLEEGLKLAGPLGR